MWKALNKSRRHVLLQQTSNTGISCLTFYQGLPFSFCSNALGQYRQTWLAIWNQNPKKKKLFSLNRSRRFADSMRQLLILSVPARRRCRFFHTALLIPALINTFNHLDETSASVYSPPVRKNKCRIQARACETLLNTGRIPRCVGLTDSALAAP